MPYDAQGRWIEENEWEQMMREQAAQRVGAFSRYNAAPPSLYPNQAAPYGSFPYADPTPSLWDTSPQRLRQDVPADPKYQGWDFNQEPIADTSAISNVPFAGLQTVSGTQSMEDILANAQKSQGVKTDIQNLIEMYGDPSTEVTDDPYAAPVSDPNIVTSGPLVPDQSRWDTLTLHTDNAIPMPNMEVDQPLDTGIIPASVTATRQGTGWVDPDSQKFGTDQQSGVPVLSHNYMSRDLGLEPVSGYIDGMGFPQHTGLRYPGQTTAFERSLQPTDYSKSWPEITTPTKPVGLFPWTQADSFVPSDPNPIGQPMDFYDPGNVSSSGGGGMRFGVTATSRDVYDPDLAGTTAPTGGTYYGTTPLGDTTLNTLPSFDVPSLRFRADPTPTPTFSSDFFDPSSSSLASSDITAQATQAMAAERSAAQLDQAAQSAGVDVSSIDPAVAAPGGYVNLDALAGQITAAQEKQAVDVSNMSSEDINTAMALSSVSGLFPGISKALGPVVRPSGGLVTKTLPVVAASTAVSNALAHERDRQTAADIEETTQVDTFASGGQVQPLPEFVQDIVSKNTQKDKDKQAAIAAAAASARASKRAIAKANAAANREKKAAARRTALARQALKDSQAAAARAQAASEKQAAKAIADAQAVLAQSRNRDRGGPSQREINAAREVLSQIDTFDSGGREHGGFDPQGGTTGSSGMGDWT